MTVNPVLAGLARRCDQRRAEGLHRTRITLDSPQSREVTVDGVRLLSFSSNDYLGLASHPDLIEAMADGARIWGAGAGASHLVTGHLAPHAALEEALAAFVGAERALLFSTGYMANLAAITTLVGRGDTVVADRLNHASLIDAALLSRARLRRYRHADADAAARLLAEHAGDRVLLATDGVFSMDGDVAPLALLADAARGNRAVMLVDDAHGIGVLGDSGRGALEAAGVPVGGDVVLMATLGKAFGSMGAFVAGDAPVIEGMIQLARPYIYTTAMPPAVVEAARAALRLVEREPWRRAHVSTLVERLRSGAVRLGLTMAASTTPVQPLLVGESARAVALSMALREQGIVVPAIRPPTVPAGGARLRISLSAAHTVEDVDRLLDALERTGAASVADAGAGGVKDG